MPTQEDIDDLRNHGKSGIVMARLLELGFGENRTLASAAHSIIKGELQKEMKK